MAQHEHLTASFHYCRLVGSATAGMASIYATSASPLLPHWDREISPHCCVMQAERVSCFDWTWKKARLLAAMHVETGGGKGMQDLGAEKDRREGECVDRDYPMEAPSLPFIKDQI